MNKLPFLLLALAATVTLTACPKKDKDLPAPGTAILGTWTQTSETLTTEPRNGGTKSTVTHPLPQPAVFIFTADGKVSSTTPGSSSALQIGTYIYTPSLLDLSITTNGVSTPVTVSEITATKMVWVILSRDTQNDYALTETFTR